MTKAEEKALKHYPNRKAEYYPTVRQYLEEKIRVADKRRSFVEGYLQGAQDFLITPEDVAKIFNKVREFQVKYPATEACFEEVAKWFNEQRETNETENC